MLRKRKSPRLQGYDYSREGAYFVTICAHRRLHHFGAVVGDAVQLSEIGEIAAAYWAEIPTHYPQIELDAFVVMPNHVHGIVFITDGKGRTGHAPSLRTDERFPCRDAPWRVRDPTRDYTPARTHTNPARNP